MLFVVIQYLGASPTDRLVFHTVCRLEMHLAGFPHLGVVDRWPATPQRARIAH